MTLPKIVFTDIDGVWTDGGMYYDSTGLEFKKFNTSDSAGVLFLKLLEIPVVIITGENSPAVSKRAEKLGIKDVYLGIKDKLTIAEKHCADLGVALSEVAYIGDDINDMELLKTVGFSAVPKSAPSYVANCAQISLKKNGGEGVFREFVEYQLIKCNEMSHVLDLYASRKVFNQ